MGAFLEKPIVDKAVHGGVLADGSAYCVCSMQGWRMHMEVTLVVCAFCGLPTCNRMLIVPSHKFLGFRELRSLLVLFTFSHILNISHESVVFDGHGGKTVSIAAYAIFFSACC